MAHRNRWFTVLKNGGCFQFAMLNNQMVWGNCGKMVNELIMGI